MLTNYLAFYLVGLIILSLFFGLLILRLRRPALPRLLFFFGFAVVIPLLIGYLYLAYFDTLPEVVVPQVVGKQQQLAWEELELHDLKPRVASQVHDQLLPEGEVISQRPEAGRIVKGGRVVNLVISAGRAKVVVPDLSGKKYQEALELLTAADLVLGLVSWETDPARSGRVLGQEPLGGEKVPGGRAVDLLVATWEGE